MDKCIIHKNVILTTYITGIYDVNRNETLPDDVIQPLVPWINSVIKNKLQGVIFHNSLSDDTVKEYQAHIIFIKIDASKIYSPNVHRYFLYRSFILQNVGIKNLFVTDSTDVTILNNPFHQPLFKQNANMIFCGDEPKKLDNVWMQSHSEQLRSKIVNFVNYEQQFKHETLLNCGIIGGSRKIMLSFLDELCNIHELHNTQNNSTYTGDMGAFNYIIRTKFNKKLIHGAPVNTVFKLYENDRKDCWFQHK